MDHYYLQTKMSPLLTVFNTLIDALSKIDHEKANTIYVKSNTTAFSIRQVQPSGRIISPITSRTSMSGIQLEFPIQNISSK